MAKDRQMAELSQKQKETLEDLLLVIDSRLYLVDVDYARGIVVVGYHYENYDEDKWLEVNVGSDSVPAIFHDVFNKVYDKIMY